MGEIHDGVVASRAEAHAAMERFESADYVKLMKTARHFGRTRLRGTIIDPEDLLHEAITKTLDGRRSWNTSVSIVMHLVRTMESDSGHEMEKRQLHGSSSLPDNDVGPTADAPSPEAQAELHEELEHARDLFTDDDLAMEIIRLRSDDLSAAEIQLALGIDKTQYETTTKRIKRRVAKHLVGGGYRP